jgi:hypothetical protein
MTDNVSVFRAGESRMLARCLEKHMKTFADELSMPLKKAFRKPRPLGFSGWHEVR